ncbi:unnamed protein product, partial [Protopolystoma xenopodis]
MSHDDETDRAALAQASITKLADALSQVPREVAKAWYSMISQVSVNGLHKFCRTVDLSTASAAPASLMNMPRDGSPNADTGTDGYTNEASPVLSQHHRICEACKSCHLPKDLPSDLRLQLAVLYGPDYASRILDSGVCCIRVDESHPLLADIVGCESANSVDAAVGQEVSCVSVSGSPHGSRLDGAAQSGHTDEILTAEQYADAPLLSPMPGSCLSHSSVEASSLLAPILEPAAPFEQASPGLATCSSTALHSNSASYSPPLRISRSSGSCRSGPKRSTSVAERVSEEVIPIRSSLEPVLPKSTPPNQFSSAHADVEPYESVAAIETQTLTSALRLSKELACTKKTEAASLPRSSHISRLNANLDHGASSTAIINPPHHIAEITHSLAK